MLRNLFFVSPRFSANPVRHCTASKVPNYVSSSLVLPCPKADTVSRDRPDPAKVGSAGKKKTIN